MGGVYNYVLHTLYMEQGGFKMNDLLIGSIIMFTLKIGGILFFGTLLYYNLKREDGVVI